MLKFGKDALYERLLKEKDRQVEILADQIDYLRAQLASRGIAVPGAALNPSGQPELGVPLTPYLMEVKNHVSDEELDAEAINADGELNAEQMREVIDALGLAGIDNISLS